ncbi:hypothetical protein C1645_482185 [Glomus cerebriforme]|uniref:Uncharacterized protein n=1 Tax=Glomus cerebriforme TaxID=658196 RepID=A0A397S9S8_9GLOM|nr:hypothetical protein C1645_482185 [Glomus cerebriforme]
MSTQVQYSPYQDFFDGCVSGLLPILFVTLYGTKTSPYLGKFAYFMDDILVFGLLFFGPFVAMFIVESLQKSYIFVLFSITALYALFAMFMSVNAFLYSILNWIAKCTKFIFSTLLPNTTFVALFDIIETFLKKIFKKIVNRINKLLPTPLPKLLKPPLPPPLTILMLFLVIQNITWTVFSFKTNLTMPLYGKIFSLPILMSSLLIFQFPIKYHFFPIIFNLIYQMIWLAVILSNSYFQTKTYLALTILAVGRLLFYITDKDDRLSGGILNFISENAEKNIIEFNDHLHIFMFIYMLFLKWFCWPIYHMLVEIITYESMIKENKRNSQNQV